MPIYRGRTMAELVRRQALKLYYGLLRAQQIVFRGDTELLVAAKRHTRDEFARPISNAELLPSRLKEAEEAIELLKHNVIQAERMALPNYYRLNFRPGIEINDGHVKGKVGKCC